MEQAQRGRYSSTYQHHHPSMPLESNNESISSKFRYIKLTNPGTRVSLVEYFAPWHIYSISIDYLVSNIQDVLQIGQFP